MASATTKSRTPSPSIWRPAATCCCTRCWSAPRWSDARLAMITDLTPPAASFRAPFFFPERSVRAHGDVVVCSILPSIPWCRKADLDPHVLRRHGCLDTDFKNASHSPSTVSGQSRPAPPAAKRGAVADSRPRGAPWLLDGRRRQRARVLVRRGVRHPRSPARHGADAGRGDRLLSGRLERQGRAALRALRA